MKTTNNRWVLVFKIVVFMIFLVLVGYIVMQFRSSWRGPEIIVRYPIPGQTVYSPIISISGETRYVAQLTIAGAPVPIVLKSNTFWTETSIPLGASSITIDGYSRSGDKTTVSIPVLRKEKINNSTRSPEELLLEQLKPSETPFRATSDLLEAAENLAR